MRNFLLLALFASLLFLFGCPGGEQPPANVQTPVQQPPVSSAPPTPAVNASANATLPANGTNSTAAIANDTNGSVTILPDQNGSGEEQVFLGIPRNVSDKIDGGEFWLTDTGLEQLKIYVISCGNADCILVGKGHFHMLIDAGNAEPVKQLLTRLGVMKIDVMVATRDDPGAIGGLGELLNEYEVGEFWYNGLKGSSPEYTSLLMNVKSKGITVKLPKAGDAMNVSGLKVAVLNPQNPPLNGNPDVDAVVLKLSTKDMCMLLLNPTIQEREIALMNSKESLACGVMTYFKHGDGRPTPSLLVEGNNKPNDVIISVGPNDLGLPSPTTITRLQISKINVWRTDSDGTLAVFSKITGGYDIGKYNATGDSILPK